MSGFKSNNLFRLLEWMASIAKATSRTAITEQKCIFDNQNDGWLFIAIVYGYMGPTWLINGVHYLNNSNQTKPDMSETNK